MKQLLLQWYPPYILDLLPLPNWMPLFSLHPQILQPHHRWPANTWAVICSSWGVIPFITCWKTLNHSNLQCPHWETSPYPTMGKGKSSTQKCRLGWDILVARKVYDTSSLGVSYINNVHMHKFIWANCVTRLDLVSKAIHVMVCPDINYVL